MRRPLPPAFELLCAALSLAVAVSASETSPFELALPVVPVELDLHDCRIEIDTIGGAEPRLRVRTSPGDGGDTSEFEVSDAGGLIRIARIDTGGVAAKTPTVELVLDPAQALVIRGQGLSISIRSPISPSLESQLPKAAAGDDGSAPQTKPAPYSFDLLDSEVYLVGTPAATITGTNTVIHGEDGEGDLTVVLERGSLSLRRHEGRLHLKSSGSVCSVEDLNGTIDFALDGGSLDLSDGSGAVQGNARAGSMSLDRWTGTVRLTGEEATFEIRDGSLSQVNLTGTSTRLALEGCRGSITAHLTGGTLTAEALRGSLQATVAQDARVEVTHHEGPLTLAIRDNSSAEISEIDGPVKTSVMQAELRLAGATTLEMTASDARLTVARVRQITKFDAGASEYELDLRDTEGREFDLGVVHHGSAATVFLASPCRVQLRASAAASDRVDVTGCEFQMQYTGRWRGGDTRGIDGRPTFLLTAAVGEGSFLRVRGGP